jgi:hypothetical protein
MPSRQKTKYRNGIILSSLNNMSISAIHFIPGTYQPHKNLRPNCVTDRKGIYLAWMRWKLKINKTLTMQYSFTSTADSSSINGIRQFDVAGQGSHTLGKLSK